MASMTWRLVNTKFFLKKVLQNARKAAKNWKFSNFEWLAVQIVKFRSESTFMRCVLVKLYTVGKNVNRVHPSFTLWKRVIKYLTWSRFLMPWHISAWLTAVHIKMSRIQATATYSSNKYLFLRSNYTCPRYHDNEDNFAGKLWRFWKFS